MRASETVGEVTGALVLANTELKNPVKDTKGQARGNRNYAYAGLPGILDEVRPILTKNGLVAVQEDLSTPEGVGTITRILHTSGEWLEFGPLLMERSNDAQINGATLTYCRRYQLTAALGLAADEDDDGRSAAPAVAAPGGSTVRANTGEVPSPRDARDAQAVAKGAQPAVGTDGATTAPPSHSATDQSQVRTGTDEPAAGDGPSSGGVGSTPAAGSPNYLSRDDQALLKVQYGGQVAAIQAYQARFPGVTKLSQITYEMRDEKEGASA